MLKKVLSVVLSLCLVAALFVPAMAAEFTPSVNSKPAPEVVPVEDEDGEEYAAIIYDENEDVVAYVPYGEIIVTPVSEKDKAKYEIIKKNLEDALKQIYEAESLEYLCNQLKQAVSEVDSSVDLRNLVVRDLFDVIVTGIYADYMAVEGNHLSVTFDLSMSSDFLMAVLHNVGGETWEAIMGNRLTRSGNTATCVFYSLSAVAFLVEGDSLPVDPDGPSSPQTNGLINSSNYYLWIAAGVVAAAGIAVIVVKSRKKASAAE